METGSFVDLTGKKPSPFSGTQANKQNKMVEQCLGKNTQSCPLTSV